MHKRLTKETLKIFWKHSLAYKWHLFFVLSGSVFIAGLRTYIPVLYRDLLNALPATTVPAGQSDPAMRYVFLILATSIFSVLFRRIWNFVNNFFQSRVMADLMNTCYRYLQQHSYNFFTSKFVGSLVTKVKRYEKSFEMIADQTTYDLGGALLETIAVLVVLFWQYRLFGIIMLVWVIGYLTFSYLYGRYKLPFDIKRAQADTHATAQLADGITNNVNIKSFAHYEAENRRFVTVTDAQFKSRKKAWDLNTISELVQGISMVALEFTFFALGVHLFRSGAISVGDLALLQAYLIRIFDKLWNTGKNIQRIYEAVADANEMTEILLLPHAIRDAKDAKELAMTKGEIAFDAVSFGYHSDRAILDNFTLTIAPGERVALVGPSGGGKSTILKLLTRFYDVRSGTIRIDGQDIKTVTQDSLRKAVSLVPQDPILFHRTLAENIRYGRPEATDDEVIAAAKLAHAHEFITRLSQGYETLVGERGIKLSGGERQRVAIARAILKNAPILVLDEATSSLDSESEMFIQDALTNLMKGRTTIVVAHRLSTIMQMDRIVVIEGGKIIEEGGHRELLKARQGTYQKLWHIQAGGFAHEASA